LVPQINLTN